MVPSILKSAHAITEGVSIFISYRHEDCQLAETLKQIIRKLGRGRIKQVFMSQDPNSIPPGTVWRDRIRSALQQAHRVYLLLPGVARDRGWVLYEAGMFQASRLPGDKLIWFYQSDQPEASQIDDLQGVKLTEEDIYEFLQHEFFQSNAVPGMNPITEPDVFKEEELRSFATQLIVNKPSDEDLRRVYYVDYLDLAIAEKKEFSVHDLKESKILSCSDTRSIFGREDNVTTFGELVERIDDDSHGNVWIEELANAINSVLNKEHPATIQATFQGFTEGQSYRPLLYTTRIRGDGTFVSFHIALVPSLYTPMSRQPREMEALMTAFRLGYRFRWEVLEEYDRKLSPRDVDAVERIVQRMEAESISRGAYDEETLARAFDRPDDKQKLSALFQGYLQFRNASADGKLDKAFESRDPTMLRECLRELRKINNEFMHLAPQQFCNLIQKYWERG
jgi:hypothetical protein